MPVYACCLGDDCNSDQISWNLIIGKVLKEKFHITQFWITKVEYEATHLLNGVQIHLSMKVENQPQQKKEHSINLHLLLKGLHREFPEKDTKHWSTDHWAMKQQTLDHRGEKKKRKKKYWMCLMKMLHHVCLIPFCIIDMNYWYDSCKVFFKQLNNLLMSMLPQRVPDLDKKLNSPFFFLWDSQWVVGLLPLSPHMKRPVMCCGPRWRHRIWSWT